MTESKSKDADRPRPMLFLPWKGPLYLYWVAHKNEQAHCTRANFQVHAVDNIPMASKQTLKFF